MNSLQNSTGLMELLYAVHALPARSDVLLVGKDTPIKIQRRQVFELFLPYCCIFRKHEDNWHYKLVNRSYQDLGRQSYLHWGPPESREKLLKKALPRFSPGYSDRYYLYTGRLLVPKHKPSKLYLDELNAFEQLIGGFDTTSLLSRLETPPL